MTAILNDRVVTLNETYTDAVNRAVAEDRMELVLQLEQEFEQSLAELQVAS